MNKQRRNRKRRQNPPRIAHVTDASNERADKELEAPAEARCEKISQDAYDKERAHLIEGARVAGEEHSKHVLTIACAAFGASLAFVDKIAPQKHLDETWGWLALSWSCLGLSIVSMIAAYLATQKAVEEQLQILDQQLLKGTPPELGPSASKVEWLNWLGSWTLCSGIVLLGVFAILNIKDSRDTIAKGKQSIVTEWNFPTRLAQEQQPMAEWKKVDGSYKPVRGPVTPDIKKTPPSPAPPPADPNPHPPKKNLGEK